MTCNNEEQQTLTEKAVQRLHGGKGRLTGQRRLILELLESFSDHPTAEEVYERARKELPQVNLSTVYRTLRWLQKEGLISVRVFPDQKHQERFDPNLSNSHHHFICQRCEKVIEFDELTTTDDMVKNFESRTGVQVEKISLVLYGLCPACLKQVSFEKIVL